MQTGKQRYAEHAAEHSNGVIFYFMIKILINMLFLTWPYAIRNICAHTQYTHKYIKMCSMQAKVLCYGIPLSNGKQNSKTTTTTQ